MAAAETCVMPREDKSSSPSKKHSEKRRAGRSSSRRKEKVAEDDDDDQTVVVTPDHSTTTTTTTEKNSFDLSAAIASVREGIWVSAVSGTRMGSSLEAALLEKGVTAVVSTLEKAQKTETFEQHTISGPNLRALHDACDFVNQALSEGGAVFVHSKPGFSRSEWAVLVVLGYMIKYENVKLSESVDSLSSTARHPVSVSLNFRRDLALFEEEVLGESSVSQEWILGEEEEGRGTKNHSLSRRKLAENLNDRRLLKKKSPHK